MTTPTEAETAGAAPLKVLWLNAGLSCDGDSVALTAAMRPSIEDLAMGAIPGVPAVELHWPLIAFKNGADFLQVFHDAADGKLEPFLLVVEGSMPNEALAPEGGYWAAFGNDPDTGQPRTTTEWLDRLAPHAWGILAAGTCATYGGIHAMEGNPTGAMGVPDHLGWDWSSQAGLPVVCVPGCPTQPDTLAEVLLYLIRQHHGTTPMIPLDDALRPTWLFSQTVHQGCDRGGYYEEGRFASSYGQSECIVKQGCWGPVVLCNVPKRGWINGMGGCPNVGGICIGCTMPGFPDKFMPFMDEPPGGKLSSFFTTTYGSGVRKLREMTVGVLDQEPQWRSPGDTLTTGHQPTWDSPPAAPTPKEPA